MFWLKAVIGLPFASLRALAPEEARTAEKLPLVSGLIVHARVLVPMPLKPVAVTPERLFTLPVVIGAEKVTVMPVICQGSRLRAEVSMENDCEPNLTRKP